MAVRTIETSIGQEPYKIIVGVNIASLANISVANGFIDAQSLKYYEQVKNETVSSGALHLSKLKSNARFDLFYSFLRDSLPIMDIYPVYDAGNEPDIDNYVRAADVYAEYHIVLNANDGFKHNILFEYAGAGAYGVDEVIIDPELIVKHCLVEALCFRGTAKVRTMNKFGQTEIVEVELDTVSNTAVSFEEDVRDLLTTANVVHTLKG